MSCSTTDLDLTVPSEPLANVHQAVRVDAGRLVVALQRAPYFDPSPIRRLYRWFLQYRRAVETTLRIELRLLWDALADHDDPVWTEHAREHDERSIEVARALDETARQLRRLAMSGQGRSAAIAAASRLRAALAALGELEQSVLLPAAGDRLGADALTTTAVRIACGRSPLEARFNVPWLLHHTPTEDRGLLLASLPARARRIGHHAAPRFERMADNLIAT